MDRKRTWIRPLVVALLLVLFAVLLFRWLHEPDRPIEREALGSQQGQTNVIYTKKELEAEAERTYAVLKQHGIRVYGWSASVYVNAAKIIVDPRDKEKLSVTQEGVPNEHYYRLLRENDPAPVYIMFEGPYVHPVGID